MQLPSSFSVRGQLHRPTPRPSPKLDMASALPLFGAPLSPVEGSAPSRNSPKPLVLGSFGLFALGIPKAVMGVPLSGFWVCGLYLNQPKRTSVSNELLMVL